MRKLCGYREPRLRFRATASAKPQAGHLKENLFSLLTSQSFCLRISLRHFVWEIGYMARTPQDITDAELEVLQVLWKHGASPIRRITELLYGDYKTSQYATVQKLLERLESKECVTRDRSDNVHVFSAGIDRNGLVGRRLQAVAEELCEGSLTPLLTNLVQMQKLSAKDRQMLRNLIDELDPGKSDTKEKRKGK
jgi:BlaI family transcriptional regulator, penicillinase repressor